MTSTHTPWGPSQTESVIAPGIINYETASHGGIWLSRNRIDEMPHYMRGHTWGSNGDHWYEEDNDWGFVALSWPQYFTERQLDAARQTIGCFHPEVLKKWMADPMADNRREG